MNWQTFALICLVGALIGAVGIGGFLVVPVLIFFDGQPLRNAVIAATVSFVGSGLVSSLIWFRQRKASSDGTGWFLLTTVSGALVGAILLRVISGATIGFLVALAVGLAGVGQLFGLPKTMTRHSNPTLAAINGFVTGTASALTGTSGPLIAMPLLALAGVPIFERIRIGQVAQLPIAATAAAVFLSAGDIAWPVAVISALALAAGAVLGMRFTRTFKPTLLSRISAALMLLTAASMLGSAWYA